MAWYPIIETGGVPLTGFKLYSVYDGESPVLQFDGSDRPEILTATVSSLLLNQEYAFYVTGLNPLEGEESDHVSYWAAGRPTAVGEITEILPSRTG
jgi:hypothetical protein